jgi:ribonuclease D
MSWNEMMQKFRNRIQNKRSEGYAALVDMWNEFPVMPGGKARILQMMHYYSELNGREELFQELRAWRNEQAGKESKSPFILASNRMLRMISAFLPQTVEELRQIPGFGEYKTGLYGEPLLRMTSSYSRTTSFPLNWISDHIDPSGFEDWVRQQWDLRAKNEAERRETKMKLLEGIAEGFDLEGLQQRLNLPSRELLTRIEELDKEGYDMEPLIEPALRDLSQKEKEEAWQAFKEAGDRFLKPIVKRLYGDEREPAGAQLEKTYEWLRLLRLRFRRHGGEASGMTAVMTG